uniref:uncharacterized protein LOC122584010 n=1 Tax=Erigeron canadensis TaxID=72917 RepID=UPI001CB98F15|nr:uncharacterized protein LOC122584010 [Erigeron canadensis]
MSKVLKLVKKSKKALGESSLVKVLQSEIRHELSNDLYKNERGSLGDFVIDWDSSQSRDIMMRKKCESGEEVAISALLGDETFLGDVGYPKEAEMKVCVKKTGLSSILQFDCKVVDEGQDKVDFHIQNAFYLKWPTNLSSSVYRGPEFRDLDPDLQQELKHYLISKGIGESFSNFLLHYLHKKEQNQYINWLQNLEALAAKS